MTDLDERLRTAGEAFRQQPVPDLNLHWPQEKRAHRWLAPLAVAAAVALVVGGVAAVKSWSHDSAQPPAKPAPVIAPDRNFAVVLAPVPFVLGTELYRGGLLPVCTKLTSETAATHAAADGVVGVVTLSGSSCTFELKVSSIRLVGKNGKLLPVATGPGKLVSAGYVRLQSTTQVRVGFAWTGFYCGPAPVAVQVTVSGVSRRVPLTGPIPACGRGMGHLVSGGVGVAGQAVVPAPAAWTGLHASLRLPSTITSRTSVPLTVILTNTTAHAISLSAPCATWNVSLQVSATGTTEESRSSGDLCSRALAVPEHGQLTLLLPAQRLDFSRVDVAGASVTVWWAMAGVPVATAKSVLG